MSEKVSKILYLALSLLVAIVLWLYVDNENDNTAPKQFNNLPIEFIGAEDTLPNRNLMLSGGADATLDLRISGPRTLISSLNRDDIRVQVDLSGISTTGTHTRSINIYYPDNVDRSRITEEYQSRSAVTVQVSPLYSRTIPVNVTPIGVDSLASDDYIYMSPLLVAEPSTLTISGREEDVDQIESARITVDLTGASATVQREFDYELLDGEGNVVSSEGIRVSSRRVEVTAPIYLSKELPLRVKFKQSPGSMESDIVWSLSVDSVTVAGEPASLEGVEEIVLDEVDLSALLSDTELPMKIGIPAGCENSSGITTTTLSVQFRNLETQTFSVSNIIPTGLAEGQTFSRLTNSLDVLLRGPASELEEVTEEDIRVVVDLTEYGNGTQYVPATVFVDGHSSVGAVGTYTVAGKISS